MRDFEPHDIDWTREKAARFWKYMSGRKVQPTYFSQAVGVDLVARVRRYGVPLAGRVLDYGCGPGYLLAALLRAGVGCEGADFDPGSLDRARALVGGDPRFGGVTLLGGLPTGLESASYDVVFCVETIEHLLPAELSATLNELQRVVRPQGYLVVTTPNEEVLDSNKTMCPECGAIFHLVQHVTSWSATTLSAALKAAGFESVACEAVTLRPKSALNWARVVRAKLRGSKAPHLIFVGRKGAQAVDNA